MSFKLKPKNSTLKSHLTLDVLKVSSSPKKASLTKSHNCDFGEEVPDISADDTTDKTRLFAVKRKKYRNKLDKNPTTTKSCAEFYPQSETSRSGNSIKSLILVGSQYRSMVFYNNPRLINIIHIQRGDSEAVSLKSDHKIYQRTLDLLSLN